MHPARSRAEKGLWIFGLRTSFWWYTEKRAVLPHAPKILEYDLDGVHAASDDIDVG
jgi:hypothetical protein